MRMPSILKDCEDVRDFLMDYLDEKLPKSESFIFRLHIFLCSACRTYMKRYNSSVEISKNIMDDPPPPELINITNEFLKKRIKDS